jgi:hypothetical protein
MIVNSLDVLNPIFHFMDAAIQDYGVDIYIVLKSSPPAPPLERTILRQTMTVSRLWLEFRRIAFRCSVVEVRAFSSTANSRWKKTTKKTYYEQRWFQWWWRRQWQRRQLAEHNRPAIRRRQSK